jgi:glycosyltransferase involved in cell wall biosynthesis
MSQLTPTISGPASADTAQAFELSVVLPCLNERETVGTCVQKAVAALEHAGVHGEVIVADNGSTDGSIEIAQSAGARVVHVEHRGYGNALRGGIQAAHGTYVLMADSDDSYDFAHIPRFLKQLREGSDLVMGNRFLGGIRNGAMPPLHRYVGNPVLTAIGRRFFHSPSRDFHCGIRAFRKDSYDRMDIRSTGMEFASEMVVKASLLRMRVSEVPTTLSPDGRSHPPHLRTWHDGWRHLRFSTDVQPTLAVSLSWSGVDCHRPRDLHLAAARPAARGQCGFRFPYVGVRFCRHPRRISTAGVCGLHQDFRYYRRAPARRSTFESSVRVREARNRITGRRAVRPAGSCGIISGALDVGTQ